MKDSIPGLQNFLKLERKNPKEKSQTNQRKKFSQLNILNAKTHDQSTSKEKLKEINDDIEKLYKKYAQVKKERLMKEKSQQILVNRIKVLKHQESSSRNKENMRNTFRSENENKIHVTINSRYKNNNNLLKKFKNYDKKPNFSNDSGIRDSNDRTVKNYHIINSNSNFNNTFDRSHNSIGIGNITNSIDNSALNSMNNENINLNNINELLKRYNIGNKNSNNNIYIIINNPNNNFSDNKIIKNSSDEKNKNNVIDNDKSKDQSNNADNTKENNKDFNLGNDKKGENIILMNTDGKKIEDIINSINNINNSNINNINNSNIISINESDTNNKVNDNKNNLSSDVNKEDSIKLNDLKKEDKNNGNNKNEIIDEHNNNIEVSSIKNENSNIENNPNKYNNENKENNSNQTAENINISNNNDIINNLNEDKIEENKNITQNEKSDNKDNNLNNLKVEGDDKENNLIKNNVDDDNNINNNNDKKEDKQSRPNFLDLYNNDITNNISKQKIDIKSYQNSNITENSENKTEKNINDDNNEQNNEDKNITINANKDKNNENEKMNKNNNSSIKKIIYHKYNNSTRIQPKQNYSSLVVHSTPNENKIRKKVIISNNNINKMGQNESNFVYLKKKKLEGMYNFSTKSELRVPEASKENNKLFNIINKTIKVEGNKTQKKLESLNTNLYTPTKLQNNNLLKVNKRPERTFTNIQRTKNTEKMKNINLRGRKNNDLMNYSLSYKSLNNNSNYLNNSHSSVNYNTQRNINFEKIRKNNFKKDAYCTSIEKKRKALGLQYKINFDKELCIESERNNYNKKMFDKIKNYKINKKGINYKNIGDINKLIKVNKRDEGNDMNDNMNNNTNLEGINATSKRFRIIKKNYVKDKHIFSKNKTTTNFNYVHSDINNKIRNKKLSENAISNSSSQLNDSSNLFFAKNQTSNFI